jgi:glutathione S-transferase
MSSSPAKPVTLYHHPFSRAAGTVWALEEVGVLYELRFVDIMKGEQKKPDLVGLNAMGKIPVLTDGDAVVTEGAAIALYLADRYAYGKLAPKVDDSARGTYLRWSLFASAVIEPGASAKANQWPCKDAQVGWNAFTMADVIFGGTLRYMLMVKGLEARPAFTAYVERLASRPALKRADERNMKVMAEHGLKLPG